MKYDLRDKQMRKKVESAFNLYAHHLPEDQRELVQLALSRKCPKKRRHEAHSIIRRILGKDFEDFIRLEAGFNGGMLTVGRAYFVCGMSVREVAIHIKKTETYVRNNILKVQGVMQYHRR